MFEIRSSLLASAVTAAVGLSLVAAGPAGAADKPAAKQTVVKKAAKKQTAKKTTKKKAAAPKTVTACVHNKTGATRILLGAKAKRKCPKGQTKMTWNVAGKDGAAGKNGANGIKGINGASGINGANGINGADGSVSVRDATGKRIGGFGGYFSLGVSMSLIQVIADDGGVFTYFDATGTLVPITGIMGGGGGSPLFRDAACAGPAYIPGGGAPLVGLAEMANSSARLVYRPMTGMSLTDLGPARAWKLTASLSMVPGGSPAFYELDPVGGCNPADDPPSSGEFLVQLADAITPPDGVGPLRVG